MTNLHLFRRLRRTLFTGVNPNPELECLINTLKGRAQRYPGDHTHWYIDGGEARGDSRPGIGELNVVSYAKLAPAVRKELTLLDEEVRPLRKDEIGVEAVTSYMADMKPKDLGPGTAQTTPVLQQFELDVLTGGADTQVFSTTFVQGASRECLHRAQPLTLLARFRPRHRKRAR